MNLPTLGSTPPPALLPGALLSDTSDIRQEGLSALQKGFHVLATVHHAGESSMVSASGLPNLEEPVSVDDITLRIGQLQDALNQLTTSVSKLEIRGRMAEANQKNKQELDRIDKQAADATAAAKKANEAKKKSGIFAAISNWIQAAVSIISAVFTAISAVGQLLVNPAGAAALIVATVALVASAALQITMAIDATMVACGKEGFLSETQKSRMEKALIGLGVVAAVASMLGMVGGIVVGMRAGAQAATQALSKVGTTVAQQAGKAALKETAEEVTSEVAEQVGKALLKEAAEEVSTEVTEGVAKNVSKTVAKDIFEEAAESIGDDLTSLFAEEGAKKTMEYSLRFGDKVSTWGARHMIGDTSRLLAKGWTTEGLKAGSNSAYRAAQVAAREAYKEVMGTFSKILIAQSITTGVVGGAAGIYVGVTKAKIADIEKDASNLQFQADQDQVEIKALQAMITKIQHMIEELEKELGEMMDQGQQTLAIIYGCLDSSAQTQTQILQEGAPA